MFIWSNADDISDYNSDTAEAVAVHTLETRSRVFVRLWTGMAINVIVMVLLCLIIAIFYLTRLRRRALNLVSDPSMISTAALGIQDPHTVECFDGIDELSSSQMRNIFGKHQFVV
jgi:hypothetical protein